MTGRSTSEPSFARKAWRRATRWFWLSMDDELRVVDLGRAAPPVPAPPSEVETRPLTEADLDLLPPALATEWRSRLPACRAIVAWRNGHAAAWAWVTDLRRDREGDPPFVYAVTPPRGAAYIFDVEVETSDRGHGLGTLVVGQTLALAGAGGARRAMLTMDAENEPMRHVTDHLGFETFGVLTLRRLLGIAHRDISALRTWEGVWQDPMRHEPTSSPLGPPAVG